MLDLPVQSILHQVDEQKAPISVNGQKATQSEEILTKKAIENIIVKHSMNTLSYKTISANKNTVQKEWVLVDAENQTVGRLATRVANILRGKTKPCFTPHVDCGDNYTGYPGGQRETTPAKVLASHPERVLEHAIRGMLPKNRLGDALYRNLYIYAGPEHPHQGQNPKAININDVR